MARRVSQHVRGLPLCRPQSCESRPRGPGTASPCSPPQPPQDPRLRPQLWWGSQPPLFVPKPLVCTPRGMFRQFLFKIAEGNQQCGREEKGNGDKLKKKKRKTKTQQHEPNRNRDKHHRGRGGGSRGWGVHPSPQPGADAGPGAGGSPAPWCRRRAQAALQPQVPSAALLSPPPHTPPPQHTRAEGSLS